MEEDPDTGTLGSQKAQPGQDQQHQRTKQHSSFHVCFQADVVSRWLQPAGIMQAQT
jgi:hypothetical protein